MVLADIKDDVDSPAHWGRRKLLCGELQHVGRKVLQLLRRERRAEGRHVDPGDLETSGGRQLAAELLSTRRRTSCTSAPAMRRCSP